MQKKSKAERSSTDNPPWSAADFRQARPAVGVLPELFDAATAVTLLRPRGRPKSSITKERITIRLSPEVLEAFRADGEGWQTRMDAALKDWLKTRAKSGKEFR